MINVAFLHARTHTHTHTHTHTLSLTNISLSSHITLSLSLSSHITLSLSLLSAIHQSPDTVLISSLCLTTWSADACSILCSSPIQVFRGPTCLNATNILPVGNFESAAQVTYSPLPWSVLSVVGRWFVTSGQGRIMPLPLYEQGGPEDTHGVNAFLMIAGTVIQVPLKTNSGKTYTFSMDASRYDSTDLSHLQIDLTISGFVTGTQPVTLPISTFSIVVHRLNIHSDNLWTVRGGREI